MKKEKLYLILFLLLGTGLNLSAQSARYVIPASGSLERVGSEVFVSYLLTVEHKSVSSCRTVYITPRIAGKSETLSFPPVIIKGKARNRAFERWAALNGRHLFPESHAEVTVDSRRDREVDFSTVVAYEPWMDEAELSFEERVFYCGAEEAVYNHSLAKLEIVKIPEPVVIQEPVAKAEPVIEKTKEVFLVKEGVAYIAFEQGRSIIRPMYDGNREELANIAEVIRTIEEDETAKIIGLKLTGYASPEGSEMANYRLSQKRTEAVMEYINEEFDLGLPKRMMKISSEGEDWESLRDLVEENYIPYKREILNIIDSPINADEKEYRLRAIAGGEVYRMLLEDYFPLLRRTKYQIQYKVKE